MCTPSFPDTPLNDEFNFEPWAPNDMLTFLQANPVNFGDISRASNTPGMQRRFDRVGLVDDACRMMDAGQSRVM